MRTGRTSQGRSSVPIALAALLVSVPIPAHASMDPGSTIMLREIAAIAAIVSLFSMHRIFSWIRDRMGLRSARINGFVFATLFAVFACPLTLALFEGNPLPRFNDLLLVGIVLTAYLFTWEASVYLLTLSLLVSAWVLPPSNSFAIVGFREWFRMASFAGVSIFLVLVITRLKVQRNVSEIETEDTEDTEADSFRSMHGAAVGAD